MLTVDDHTRYVIARYFRGTAADDAKVPRTRATRRQVQRFAAAALRRAVRDYAASLDARGRSVALRLSNPDEIAAEAVEIPGEEQVELPLGGAIEEVTR